MADDWAAYFREYRAKLDAENAAKNGDDAEPEFVVTTPSERVGVGELPRAAKKLLAWLSKNELWAASAEHSVTHHKATHFKSGEKAGEPKTPEHDQHWWGVVAELRYDGGKPGAALWAGWTTDRNGKTTFTGAQIWDVYTKEKVFEKQVAPFEDWLRIFAPEGAPKKKEPRKTKQEQIAENETALLAGAEWSAE